MYCYYLFVNKEKYGSGGILTLKKINKNITIICNILIDISPPR